MKTASGLEYVEVSAGTGKAPVAGDLVEVHYTGTFPDGRKFDSSVGGQPFQFYLGRGQVIKGWDEGIALMKVGGKATLIVPPELAYGSRGAGDVIPPGATLHFEVELVDIV
jgi:peptidylprolyl isomerase